MRKNVRYNVPDLQLGIIVDDNVERIIAGSSSAIAF